MTSTASQIVGVPITISGAVKTFPSFRGPVEALGRVELEIEPGSFVCLVGPSGCGKSTLLKVIAGLTEPTAGSVRFGSGAPPRTAMVFQDHGLFPWMTLRDNVAFGLEATGVDTPTRRASAEQLLGQLGLAGFAMRYPHELSGGMRQRGAIARALLTHPQVLLMDEPFSALDAQSKLVLQDELQRLWGEDRQTVLYVTHDIEEAVILGDRVLVMSGRPGRIIQDISVDLPRPRDLRDRSSEEVRTKTWSIWKGIEAQVRRNLHVPN
jgi:NitT/TauT family transport system ATP-binding protein